MRIVYIKFEIKQALTVYPNPVAGGVLHVRVAKPGVLKIYSNNGQLILNKQLAVAGKYSFHLNNLAKGIYRLAFDNETVSILVQ